LKTVILGKRSFLSKKLNSRIRSSEVFNYIEFKNFITKNKDKFNLIINSFYPSAKISKIDSYNDFYNQSVGNLSLILDKVNPKNINKIIYTSSASIYGSINELHYKNDNYNRVIYSSAKLLNEALLNNFCQKKNIQLVIARVFNMYGNNEQFSVIHKLVESAKNKKKIIIHNDGDAVRDFIHIDDICEIYLKLLNLKKSGIYDIGSGYGIRIKDILRFLNFPKNNIIYKKTKITEISNSIANTYRLTKDIKKKKFIKIENFLKKRINYKLNNKNLTKINKEYPNTINDYLNGSIIYGCGFAGKRIAKKLIELNRDNVSYFVDDNQSLVGKKYLDKKIISNSELISISKKKRISNIIIAIPSMAHDELMILYTKLLPLTLNISALPNKKNLLTNNKVVIDDLKNLDLGDIIKRKIFDIKKNSIKKFKNKSILVTGGAGSIGSEISQQILRSSPKKLLIIDNSEYSLFQIKEKLGLRKNIKYVLLDVNNQTQMQKIIKENKIKYIFHAAAYKHVSFLEENLFTAIKNNILATLSLVRAIKNTDINLTVISTDKAVEPKNVLGMTKRASEIITLSLSKENDYKKSKISIVRFGNVFGSAGSAIEIFKKQIKNNLPVTLTDIRMKRFFMSIREACNLVLQSSQLKKSSSIFVLKMGKPIKIIEIINKLFYLMKNKDQKLKVKIIGKFRSEKLDEKLSNNRLIDTSIKDINLINDKIVGLMKIQNFLDKIDLYLKNLDEKKTIKLLKKFTH